MPSSSAPHAGGAARKDHLRSWVLGAAEELPAGGLHDTTSLFEGRVLTSLQIPDLILLLEELRDGEPIDVEALQPGDFRDIDTIASRFLGLGAVP